MKELDITIITVCSTQAKGRIEGLLNTLQSRLPVEFKIARVTTVEEANKFLIEYTSKFNFLFAVELENSELAYHKITDDLIFDHILCVK